MITNKGSAKKTRGFTLIEVMVAIAIVGVALPALMFRIQTILEQTGRIEEKNYAYWIADNKYQELYLESVLSGNVEKKKDNDSIEYVDQEWFWSIEMFDTEVPGILRVEIKVGKSKEHHIARLDGYLGG